MVAEAITGVPAGCRDLRGLFADFRDRSVAIVGNASSFVEAPGQLDRHDFIIRLNKGAFMHGPERMPRMDALMISAPPAPDYLRAAPHVAWMTPSKRERLSQQEIAGMYFYPTEWQQQVETEIGNRPSTGCMAIDLVTRALGTGDLWLYGFDFWQTPTNYNGMLRPGPHSPTGEEAFARARIPEGRIFRA